MGRLPKRQLRFRDCQFGGYRRIFLPLWQSEITSPQVYHIILCEDELVKQKRKNYFGCFRRFML